MAKFLQDYMWQDSIFAIKLSCEASNFKAFYSQLHEELPQTSKETRRRNAGTIVRRFFPERSLKQATRLTWRSYEDEKLLQHLMRYQFLVSEPVIADFAAKLYVLNSEPGDRLEFRELADSFLQQNINNRTILQQLQKVAIKTLS
ncbi:hypothetical protein F7734_38905 [Scytonema sp. UIC 10036]|uniref:hypothetical protein n=1 Tax=Scytonema sp. UIC 10036 TaxID=2304196 RepID=UPI0012DAB0FA|nr:hypothetical protein [Scytonema sp. UIC 10036]MUG97962.1 hypothetical protein [Scytonema sp. UIC 10036]